MTNDGVVLLHGDFKWIVIVVKEGLIFEGKCIFENKPPPQSRSCLLLKKAGLIFGRIRYTSPSQSKHEPVLEIHCLWHCEI